MARRPGPSHRGPNRPGALGPAAVTAAARPARTSQGPVEKTAPPGPSPRVPPDHVLLGEFGRAHGLRGEVRLKSYTADPLAIAGYGPLTTSDGRSLILREARSASGAGADILVVTVEGVADRTQAEALNRLALSVPRDRLTAELEEDEVFAADLVGLAAVDAGGAAVGTIVAVPNFGGGDLLEIRPALGGPTALLPFTKLFVPELDLPNGRVVVAPPEDLFAPPGPRPREEGEGD